MQDLRAGTPVILELPQPWMALAVETASQAALVEFRAQIQGPAMLLLGSAETGSAVAGARALAMRPEDLAPARLLALAEPGAPADGSEVAPTHAEAMLKLARLALLLPAVVAARLDGPGTDLVRVAPGAVLDYHPQAQHVARVVEAAVPLAAASPCRVVAFRPDDGGVEHLAVLIGQPEKDPAPLVRLHSECFTGDLLGSLRCDCGPQLQGALRRMAAEGGGVLLYMAQEGRGIGLVNKLRAYALQDAGLDTLEANLALGFAADERSFAPAAEMLRALGIGRIRLLTNNPQKLAGLAACGIEIAGRVSHAFAANGVNDLYLETKARRFGHWLG